MLAARLKHAEFADWINRELNGYKNSDDLPDYRKISVHSLGTFSGPFGSGIRNAPIPVRHVPEKLRHFVNEQTFLESVSALSAHVSQAASASAGTLQGKWPADVIVYVQHYHPMYEDMVLADAWRVIPVAAINGILDTVRNRVLDFVLAIEGEEPTAGETAPGEPSRIPQDRVTNIYYTTIHSGQASIVHHPEGFKMGDSYSTKIKGSTIGAVAIGANAQAAGAVNYGGAALTQEEHRTALKEAQAALVRDQDSLDQLDGRLYEALGQFLRLAREIQVEQQAMAEVQARMKETLDEVWAQHTAKGLRVQTIPRTLELAEALAKNPAMNEVIKHLLGS